MVITERSGDILCRERVENGIILVVDSGESMWFEKNTYVADGDGNQPIAER